VADRITGSILDAGCGTGENALYFAGRGCQVTGIDFLKEPIRRARHKATERGVPATVNGLDCPSETLGRFGWRQGPDQFVFLSRPGWPLAGRLGEGIGDAQFLTLLTNCIRRLADPPLPIRLAISASGSAPSSASSSTVHHGP
jgi:SAM-dependent methyltransferase